MQLEQPQNSMREQDSIDIQGREDADMPARLTTLFAALALFYSVCSPASQRDFTCNGAKVKTTFPSDADQLTESSPTSCIYWKSSDPGVYPEPFGITVMISSTGQKAPEKFEDSSDVNDGTWSKLQHTENLNLSDENGLYSRIDEGIFKSKYLVSLPSGTETEERTFQITNINGTVNDKGVWVKFMISLPYKKMTKADAINMIKSTKVVRGMESPPTSGQTH